MPSHLKNTTSHQQSQQSYAPPVEGTNAINVGGVERVASLAAGGLLFYHALTHVKENPLANFSKLAVAGYLFYRGISANCPIKAQLGLDANVERENAIEIHTSFIIRKPRTEVYQYWRRVGNLPSFMSHLKSVSETNSLRSLWEAKVPGNLGTIKWEAEVTEDIPNEKIAWSSVPGSTIENAGRVAFRDATGGGTELDVIIHYRPPAGRIGSSISRLFNPVFERIVRNDIMNFKKHVDRQVAEETRLTTYSRL